MSVLGGLDRLRHRARRPLARTPYLWDLAMLARPGKRATLARRDTALVIEGFAHSGNTFSAAAFAVANGDRLHVGRHLHGAGHLLRARRLGLPAVALIRDPRDAVLSYLTRRDTITAADALTEYAHFYESAWRARDGFVVGLFDVVVRDFGSVIRAVNELFGTGFAVYEPTPANEAAAFAMVEELNRRERGGTVLELHVGRPSAERHLRKHQLLSALEQPRTAGLLRRAEELYRRYEGLAEEQGVGSAPSRATG